MRRIEINLAQCLNKIDLSAVTLEEGKEKPLEFIVEDDGTSRMEKYSVPDKREINLFQGQTKDGKKKIFHRLRRSRPYVGSVIDFTGNPEIRNKHIDTTRNYTVIG